ncbi:hypothetical protein BASA50_005097 [Batrachochytrium salamandrivorans]|uniref:F-box domain-containing protein n=1 Tax=Batrachochytrium salamandrivorans TaxID=1357716 RepID=A0ABQ8FER5_9FUNG|nr:hypothetical protein BASA50_005097 [Batrachochytrium salamandrivorans]
MRQLQLPVELLQLVFSYVSQHRYLPCSSGLDQRQDQGHEQWRGQDLSNPFAVVAEEEPYLNLSLLTGSQSMVTDTFLVRLTSLLLWNPAVLCQSTSVLVPRHAICHSRLRTLRMMDCFMVTAVGLQFVFNMIPPLSVVELSCGILDLTDRSTRLCEFDFCKPPIRKRHNLVTNPDAKVGPIFKNARTIVNMTTKANQQGCAMGSPDWIVLPSTYLYRLQLKNCRITDESIMAIFPKGVSALADAPTGSLGMFFLIDFNC